MLGLLSPGGVHSHETHIFAMLDLAARARRAERVARARVPRRPRHAAAIAPQASLARAATRVCDQLGNARIATVGGRYYAMDRDKRWDRVRRAYDAIVDAHADHRAPDALAALSAAYERGETDEFVEPTVLAGATPMHDGDAVVFMNFRADRARQLTAAFVDPTFDGFAARRPALSRFVCLTEYDARLPAPVAFAPDDLRNTLGELLAEHGLTQLRIAETEKYAHVTFFFSGGREDPYAGEDRILVPSPKVATYDLKPEMSCPEVTAKLVEAIDRATLRRHRLQHRQPRHGRPHRQPRGGDPAPREAVDVAIGAIEAAVRRVGGEMLITADHGNLEQMRDPDTGQPHTAHTVGPVPFVYVGARGESLRAAARCATSRRPCSTCSACRSRPR